MFPKDMAGELSEYKLAYWNVSRRIVRMNKRLEHETGERLFEKRGHKWALTSFAFEVFGTSESEVKEDKTVPEEEMRENGSVKSSSDSLMCKDSSDNF